MHRIITMQRRKVSGVPLHDIEEVSPFLDSEIAYSSSQDTKRRQAAEFQQGRGLCFYLSGCAGCCTLLLAMIVLIVNEGHHLTCLLHGALCTPFREYVNRFPMLPQTRKAGRAPILSRIPHSCTQYTAFLAKHIHEGRRLLFLIGESRGGSTYTYDTLNLHSDIEMIGGEALFGFSNNVCNNNLLLRNKEQCTFLNWLEALYENAYDKRSQSQKVVGTKINIEQIPPEFYEDLAGYLSCIQSSVIILHVTRASAIASFLNYQAEVPERLNGGNWDMSANSVPDGLKRPLELDPELAAQWVHTRDGLSQDLFRTLGFAAPSPLLYQRVYYEHLKDRAVGDTYWKSVFSFLGVDATVSVSSLRKTQSQRTDIRTQNKTHGDTSCSDRISNWPDVKEALGEDSLSTIVCEGHSR